MPLNDDTDDEFSAHIEDEDGSIYPPPALEMIGMRLAHDRGSGSYAEDGPQEIGAAAAADRDGYEIGAAAAADREGYEIGAAAAADRDGSEIGAADREEVEIGSYAMFGPSEIGKAAALSPFELFMMEPHRVGAAEAADRPGSEIGSYAMFGPSEIGAAAAADRDGYEIGAAAAADRDGYEIGAAAAADREGYEIGAAAVLKVVEKARDNRQPSPPMRAVDVDAPAQDYDDWGLLDVCIGAAVATGNPDPFPLFSKLMLRCGTGCPPRVVRVDTEQSYKQFRTEHSPELTELAERVDALQQKLDRHVTDPAAHSRLAEDIDELVEIGAEAEASEASKRVELWMPRRFDGLVEAWLEGDFVCASIALPGSDGEVRICTSLEPIRKCVQEMSRHAAEAKVPASTVVGVLPAMGCVLGAGTAIKEMAAAAPAVLSRPEAGQQTPFVVRVEPKTSPALSALAMLVMMCRNGDAQACDEWRRLGEQSAGPVRQAMLEAVQIAKAAA